MIKPFPRPYPKPRRLPATKRMTIAIGLRATDGLVIGADSEESTGFIKTAQQKLMPLYLGLQVGSNPAPPSGVCVFTGAGDSGYIDAVTEDLMEVLFDQTLRGIAVKKALGKRLKEFYRDHVIPFAAFPEHDRPQMEMLIAMQQHHGSLYVSDRSTLRNANHYGMVGLGRTIAKITLDALWKPAPAKEMVALMVYVLSGVKEHVESCGKYSSVMVLHNWVIQNNPNAPGSMMVPPAAISTYVPAQRIMELETLFADELARQQRDAVWEFISTHT